VDQLQPVAGGLAGVPTLPHYTRQRDNAIYLFEAALKLCRDLAFGLGRRRARVQGRSQSLNASRGLS
jgi:hypothetical protein